MKNLIVFLRYVFFVIIFLVALLIALPRINVNLGGSIIDTGLIDEYLNQQGAFISDFKKGEGLYPSNLVRATFPGSTSKSEIDSFVNTVTIRRDTALLSDIKVSVNQGDNQYIISFNYPYYYSNPVGYTKWLTSKGDISFITADQQSQILDLNDYDIDGEVKLEYRNDYKDHISFYFNSTKEALISSQLDGGNGYFAMSIDEVPSFYIINFDQYIDTNVNRVRAISTLSLINSNEREVSDYVNIVRSYFKTGVLSLVPSVDEVATELPSSIKPASLTNIAIGAVLITLIPLVIIELLKRNSIKRLVEKLIFMSIAIIFMIAFLKFTGAILSISLLIAYLAVVVLCQVFISYWDELTNARTIVLALVIFMGFTTKLYNLNYNIAFIGGVIVAGLLALFLSSYYYQVITNLGIPKVKRPKLAGEFPGFRLFKR